MPERATLDGPDGEPHATLFAEHPRVVRLTLAAGEAVPAHSHPGTDVLVHVVEGEMTVSIDGEPHELAAGELLRFDGDRAVAPRAETDAVAVVTLAPQPG